MRRVLVSLTSLGLAACQLAPDLVQLSDEVAANATDSLGEADTSSSESETTSESESTSASESESTSGGEDPTFDTADEFPNSCAGDCPCVETNCVQDCSGIPPTACFMDCPTGSTCLQYCDSPFGIGNCLPGASCHFNAQSEGCQLGCSGSTLCSMQCNAPTPCALFCDSTPSCTLTCPQGGCHVECYGSTCTIDACPTGCSMTCSPGSQCTVNCDDPASCIIDYL